MGERKTLTPFITACDKFIYIEILKTDQAKAPVQEGAKITRKNAKDPEKSMDKVNHNLVKFLTDSIDDLADESGWTFLGDLGNFILKRKPDFDPRNYGFTKMLPLIKSIDKFEIDERVTGKSNIRHIYIRLK